MNKSRLMVVGAVGSGKTTLLKAMNRDEEGIKKTQSIEYQAGSIDTPVAW